MKSGRCFDYIDFYYNVYGKNEKLLGVVLVFVCKY